MYEFCSAGFIQLKDMHPHRLIFKKNFGSSRPILGTVPDLAFTTTKIVAYLVHHS
jgi:hypothetical protein